jgi:hypothetical protein
MHRNLRTPLLIPLLLAGACKQGGGGPEYAASPPSAQPVADQVVGSNRDVSAIAAPADAPEAPAQGDQTAPPAATRDSAAPVMIIRTGTATVEVQKIDPAIAQVTRLAGQLGGYVANTSVQSGSDNVRQAMLEVKIPATRWDQALAGLRPVGKLEQQETKAENVGEEFVDVSARMANARRLETRLVELLATRTGKLDDVLAVERELARVREEIERYEGRLRYLRSNVALSTLTVNLHEPYPVLGNRPGDNPLLASFRQAWRNFVLFVTVLIASLGWLVPLALVLIALGWLIRKLRGPRRGGGGRGGSPTAPASTGPGSSGAAQS